MNEKITAHPQKEERQEVLKEIRQLENRKKILENKQRNEERRVRTRRLIERGAIWRVFSRWLPAFQVQRSKHF